MPQVIDDASPVAFERKLDIVLSFDVTGSMTPVLNSVRQELSRLTSIIFDSAVADVRMAVIAHGDYDTSFTLRQLDFSADTARITSFINDVPVALGCWNDGECYEEALRVCASQLTWRPDSKRVVVMVGDDLPHEASFHMNRARVDWVEELRGLSAQNVCVFAVQCASLCIARAERFYRALAAAHPLGRYLLLTQFYMMSELVLGIFHSARDDMQALRDHESSLVARGLHNQQVARVFASLRGEDPVTSIGEDAAASDPRLVPVSPGRFQVIPVSRAGPIKALVERAGAVFKKGRGFYQFTKAEVVQEYKEIVLEDKDTGEMYTGAVTRHILGIQDAGRQAELSPSSPAVCEALKKYNVFVQSTSMNRRLTSPSRFLYELGGV